MQAKNGTREFFRLVLNNEGKFWPEFKYVKRRKGYRGNIHGRLIIDPIEKVNSFNYYYSSVFGSEGNLHHTRWANSGEPFNIITKIIRKMVAAIEKIKSIGPDGISVEKV